MGSPRIIPFRPEHLVQIKIRVNTGSVTDYLAVGKMYEAMGPAFSAELDGKILGAAGVAILWKGVGEAWVWVPQEVVVHPLFFHRNVKAMMAEVKQMKKLVRIQTTVKVRDVTANQWIKRLGFKAEGVMRRWGPDGEDHIRYAIVEPRGAQGALSGDLGQDTPTGEEYAPPVAVNSF